MISDYYPPENRGTALSFYSSGIYVGILLGYLFGGVIAEAFGWRTAFLVVGLPGVFFAVILRLTVKEPLRGRWETSEARDAPKPTLRETLALLRDRPSFWYLALGASAVGYVSYGNGNFFPSYLIRMHGLTIAEVGMVLALVAGLTGAIGTFLGGYLGDKLGARDMRWYMWIAMIGIGLSYIPYMYIVMTDNTTAALTVLFFAFILKTLYLGPCIAISHTLVPPGMRAITSAVLFFILNMIGLGMGPFLTGLVSDLLQPEYGEQSLRYSMLITTQVSVIAVALFWMAAKHLPADLQKAGSGGSLSARST
jgi:predicted MFS family arabinose efflux permease